MIICFLSRTAEKTIARGTETTSASLDNREREVKYMERGGKTQNVHFGGFCRGRQLISQVIQQNLSSVYEKNAVIHFIGVAVL